jgi:hypothetical protein
MVSNSDGISVRIIKGSRNLNNVCWACILFASSLGFIATGFASYVDKATILLSYFQSDTLSFIPQGLVMCFYGIAGLFISLYFFFTILLNIGAGYNEFDQETGLISIFRWGFPGANRKIRIQCLISDIESVMLNTNDDFGAAPIIALQLKGNLSLPLHSKTEAWKLEDIEKEAAQLAQFLQVPLNSQV